MTYGTRISGAQVRSPKARLATILNELLQAPGREYRYSNTPRAVINDANENYFLLHKAKREVKPELPVRDKKLPFVSPKTAVRWFSGETPSPRVAAQLLMVLDALDATIEEANRALVAAGHDRISELEFESKTTLPENDLVVEYWRNSRDRIDESRRRRVPPEEEAEDDPEMEEKPQERDASNLKKPNLDATRPLFPPGSSVPGGWWHTGPVYQSREDEIAELAAYMQAGDEVVITGPPSMGKTHVAIGYAFRYARELYDKGGVFLIECRDPDRIRSKISDCGVRMGLYFGDENYSENTRLELVRRAWGSDAPKLLIFDNLEESAGAVIEWLIDEVIPNAGMRNVIFTSTTARWARSGRYRRIRLDPLPRKRGGDMLQAIAPGIDRAVAEDIAEELGGFPSLIEEAGRYIADHPSDTSPEEFLTSLRMQRDQVSSTPGSTELDAWHPERVYRISYPKLSQDLPVARAARELAACIAYLAPDESIPLNLLEVFFSEIRKRYNVRRDEVVEMLESLPLIRIWRKPDKSIIEGVTHHSAMSFLRREIERPPFFFTAMIGHLQNKTGRRTDADRRWMPHLRLMAHDLAVDTDLDAAACMSQIAFYLTNVRDSHEAILVAEHAMAVQERARALRTKYDLQREREYAHTVHVYARAHSQMGDFRAAEPIYREALKLRRALPFEGDDINSLAATLNNLGWVLLNLGDIFDARVLIEEADALRRTHGFHRGEVLDSIAHLAFGEWAMDRQFGAPPERALFLAREALLAKQAAPDVYGNRTVATTTTLIGVLEHLVGNLEAGDAALEDGTRYMIESYQGSRVLAAQRLLDQARLYKVFGQSEAANIIYGRIADMLKAILADEHETIQAREQAQALLAEVLAMLKGDDGVQP